MAPDGQRKVMKRIVFRIQNKSRCMRKDSRKDTGRSSVLQAMTSGKVAYSFERITSQIVERFKETSDPDFKGANAFCRGFLRRKTHRDTIHVNADAKEVLWYSCLSIMLWKFSSSRNLKISRENGTSLWPRWRRARRCYSLEFDVSKIAESISEVDEHFRTRTSFDTFMKEVTKWGSSIAWVPKFSYCTFVPFKDTVLGTWWRLSWWVTSLFHTIRKSLYSIENVLQCHFNPQHRTHCCGSRK